MMEEDFNSLLYKNEALFRFMGIKFTKVDKGFAELSLDYKDELTRIGGILHGAIIFASMDYAGSYAVKSLGVKDAFTIQFNILFIKQMKDPPFKFIGKVIKQTKKYAYVDVEGYSKDELSAKGSGVWHIINDRE
ncbi:PaaI family thioesterase [Acidianus manzaensis]|uniref:Esterase n=1 Tax=Acidianus manzaensis TaxID=282676 RepID=A0A1W6JWZ3_9CREN|nr:PaaI family thioesterase [Acidianus manzaensis]ARM74734.1 esterase [Acidianus manzaensis]